MSKIILIVLTASVVCAQSRDVRSKLTYVPVAFDNEGQLVRTAACIGVTERIYTAPGEWRRIASRGDKAERALVAVIDAIERKDPVAFEALSDAILGRDPKQLEQQRAAFFSQIDRFPIVGVARAYEVGGLITFFVSFRAGEREVSSPFVFHNSANGAVGFLPYRTEKLSFLLVREWFDSPWGPSSTLKPEYCRDSEIARATHAIPVDKGSALSEPNRAMLYLRGSGLDNKAPSDPTALKARLATTNIRNGLGKTGIETVLSGFTSASAARIQKWWPTASQEEQLAYRKSIAVDDPFFVFDAAPVTIAFSHSPDGNVRVLYLTQDSKPLWTNVSRFTLWDKLFLDDLVIEAASTARAFSGYAIRKRL